VFNSEVSTIWQELRLQCSFKLVATESLFLVPNTSSCQKDRKLIPWTFHLFSPRKTKALAENIVTIRAPLVCNNPNLVTRDNSWKT
jgi:hypothetical protein